LFIQVSISLRHTGSNIIFAKFYIKLNTLHFLKQVLISSYPESQAGFAEPKAPLFSLLEPIWAGSNRPIFCFIVRKIESHSAVFYTATGRDEIFNLFINVNITDKDVRKLHNKEVKELKKL